MLLHIEHESANVDVLEEKPDQITRIRHCYYFAYGRYVNILLDNNLSIDQTSNRVEHCEIHIKKECCR